MKLYYHPQNYLCWNDGDAEDVAGSLMSQDYYTSNELVLFAAQALIAEGKLTVPVIVVTESGEYPVNKYGAILDYPPELGFVLDFSQRTLLAAMKRKKAERAERLNTIEGQGE